jgi:transcriptional regulator with XRE-family HTH domain
MRDLEPTIRSRELGEGLRQAIERAQFNGKQLAAHLGWSESHVSRLLTGRRGAKEVEVAAILALCGVTGEEHKRLMDLCQDQKTKSWFQQFGSRLPTQVRTLIDHENKAAQITEFEALMMPGLLQTDAYARALISRNANVPSDEVEDRVAARAARRIIFSRPYRPTCSFFIHEFVLRLQAESEEVMSDQLHNLLQMSVRPYINIQVIPAEVGVHAGMGGAFTLLEAPEYKSVVYLEGETSGLFLEKPEEVAAYRNVIRELSSAALDEGESKELIATVAIDLYGDREDQHDHA